MAVKTYGIQQAVRFYTDVFALEKRHVDDEHAFFYVGEHQFLALKKVERMPPEHDGHFGLIVRDADQLEEVKDKVTRKYGLTLSPGFACDFRDPFGNRVQVADPHDESLIWLLPYRECQKADVVFSDNADQGDGWQ